MKPLVQDLRELQCQYDEWHLHAGAHTISGPDLSLWRLVLDLLRPGKNKIADIGCGKGVFVQLCSRIGLEAIGLDISVVALRQAKEHEPAFAGIGGSAESLPLRTSSLRCVTCLGSLEHFFDMEVALREMYRILEPGGLLCLLVPNAFFVGHIYFVCMTGEPPTEGGQSFSERLLTRASWERLIERLGFALVRTVKYNDVRASQRVGSAARVLFHYFLRHMLPTNLSYGFILLCRKPSSTRG